MKDTRYANRGMPFEQLVKYANKAYRQQGLALISKIPTEFIPIRDRSGKIVSCKVEEKATVDFMGRVGSRPIAIEAKHTSTDSIRWDEVQDHQNQFLTDFCVGMNGISVVLVSFNLTRFYAVPWHCWKAGRDAWKEAQRKGNRKAEIKECVSYDKEGTHNTWKTNGKASVKAEDLLPEWEIEMGGRVALDYLRRYI